MSDFNINDFNRSIIQEFRTNGGEVGGQFANAPLLLLTTTGAKSGRQRTTPLAYTKDGDRLVVLASKAGAHTNPAWYHNLVAHPKVTVEVGEDRFEAEAVVISGEERQRLFQAQAEAMPGFADYQQQTTRQIPVIVLKRAD